MCGKRKDKKMPPLCHGMPACFPIKLTAVGTWLSHVLSQFLSHSFHDSSIYEESTFIHMQACGFIRKWEQFFKVNYFRPQVTSENSTTVRSQAEVNSPKKHVSPGSHCLLSEFNVKCAIDNDNNRRTLQYTTDLLSRAIWAVCLKKIGVQSHPNLLPGPSKWAAFTRQLCNILWDAVLCTSTPCAVAQTAFWVQAQLTSATHLPSHATVQYQ